MAVSPDLPTDPAKQARLQLEAMSHGSLDDFRELVHPDAINREARIEPPECRGRGPAAWHATALWLRNMAPDISWDIHEVVAGGDLVAVHCTMTGHQTGDHTHYDAAGGVQRVFPATNRAFATTQTHWLRYQDGKLIEHWANRDDLGTAEQLGWVPPTPLYLARMALAKRRAVRLATA